MTIYGRFVATPIINNAALTNLSVLTSVMTHCYADTINLSTVATGSFYLRLLTFGMMFLVLISPMVLHCHAKTVELYLFL